MEHQNIINILDNTATQPKKFRTKNWVEINHKSRRIYSSTKKLNLKLQC